MARGRKSSGRMASLGHPNPIDVHVGSRLRLRRTLLGFSQERLAEAIGVTFQQVQKYERGTNRIGSSRLFDLARVMDVPVSYFFEGMTAAVASRSPSRARGLAESKAEAFELDPMAKRETLELVRAYYRIADPQVRKRVFELAKSLGKTRRSSQ
ncbi:MAG: helix-turn-helix domain-containing protein [Dongiaceae bacterium]